jgi:hypothetical protein
MMGGLDGETEQSHRQTLQWLRANQDALWLFNLYNFVPYPLTPDFPRLRKRIVNWNFADWREDSPVVYQPSHLTRERSWELFQEKIATAHEIVRAGTHEGSLSELVPTAPALFGSVRFDHGLLDAVDGEGVGAVV